MFDYFLSNYRAERWNATRGGEPVVYLGTRSSILRALFYALKLSARNLWGNVSGARRRRMQEEERDIMSYELPPRLVHGKRMVNDSHRLLVHVNELMSNEEADQILRESDIDNKPK